MFRFIVSTLHWACIALYIGCNVT